MFFWNKICALAALFLFPGLYAPAQNISSKTYAPVFKNSYHLNIVGTIGGSASSNTLIDSTAGIGRFSSTGITINPFFCKLEYRLEKTTKIPFRFRLGSVAQCDFYEGKNHASVLTVPH